MNQLKRFQNKEYQDYKYGNPSRASKNLEEKLNKLEEIIKEMGEDIEMAGSFLSPAIEVALKEEIKKIIDKRRTKWKAS